MEWVRVQNVFALREAAECFVQLLHTCRPAENGKVYVMKTYFLRCVWWDTLFLRWCVGAVFG